MLMKAGGRIMSAAEYEESLRQYSPTVYVDGDRVDCTWMSLGSARYKSHRCDLRFCAETGVWRPDVG